MGTTKQELTDYVGALKNFQLGPSIFFFSIPSRVVVVQAELGRSFQTASDVG